MLCTSHDSHGLTICFHKLVAHVSSQCSTTRQGSCGLTMCLLKLTTHGGSQCSTNSHIQMQMKSGDHGFHQLGFMQLHNTPCKAHNSCEITVLYNQSNANANEVGGSCLTLCHQLGSCKITIRLANITAHASSWYSSTSQMQMQIKLGAHGSHFATSQGSCELTIEITTHVGSQ